MATVSKSCKMIKKRATTISRKLFYSVIILFAAFTAMFVLYQYSREQSYKVELLNARLQDYNNNMYENIVLNSLDKNIELADSLIINNYIKGHSIENIRVTIINADGQVLYESKKPTNKEIENHLNRNEVKKALQSGEGYAINRLSETTGENYFYSATYYPQNNIIIRSALPYSVDLINMLQTDATFLWFALAIFVALTFFLLQFSRSFGASFKKLRDFAECAAKNQPLDTFSNSDFPNNELGDISKHIIHIYKGLLKNKEDKARIKHQLTQNIAHELKTPVASIQGYLETIINNPNIDEATKQKFIERCFAQTERLTHLINDITTLNRIDDNTISDIENEPVNINQLISDIENQVSLQLEERKIKFNNLLPSGIMTLGNRSLLYSIFRNLTDNAINYAGEGTTITLKCDNSTKEFYTFTFYDNGIGVPDEHLNKIFERFYRIDKGRSRALGGTGLGLAIVKNAVLHHGGKISVHNQPGGGLGFTFTIRKL